MIRIFRSNPYEHFDHSCDRTKWVSANLTAATGSATGSGDMDELTQYDESVELELRVNFVFDCTDNLLSILTVSVHCTETQNYCCQLIVECPRGWAPAGAVELMDEV